VTRWVLHVDLDQFIAAVEVLRRPELRGRPVVVGGDGDPAKRGVVSTASYEARAFGVHSGLALRTARRRCPDAVFLPVDTGAYEAASAEVMATLAEFDVVVEVAGWDEAFLATGTDDPEALARRIQDRIRAVTSLDCTVGIGENKLQAKLAAGFGKPAGIFRLTHQSWYAVLGDRPTDALWGVGAKTARRLAALGIHTVADLAGTDPRDLAAHLGPVTGPWLVQTARGLSPAPVDAAPYVPRSHGQEVTYQRDITDWEQVRSEVTRLAHRVAAGIAGEQRPARRVVVKVRYAPFFTQTHGHPLPAATSDATAIEQAALAALGQFRPGRPVRLLGVRAEFTR
jgi:nucleotidyltransferase/DNA polymerase involved in DNA repair